VEICVRDLWLYTSIENMKFLTFAGCIALGFCLIRYAKWLVDATGLRFDGAEKFFGYGGTYTALKIIGVLAIVFAFYYTFGMK